MPANESREVGVLANLAQYLEAVTDRKVPVAVQGPINELIFTLIDYLPEALQKEMRQSIFEVAQRMVEYRCDCGHPAQDHTLDDEACTVVGCRCMFLHADL